MNCTGNDNQCRYATLMTCLLVIVAFSFITEIAFYKYIQPSMDFVIHPLATTNKTSVVRTVDDKIELNTSNMTNVTMVTQVPCKSDAFFAHEPLHYDTTLDRALLHKCQFQRDNGKKNNAFPGLIFNNGKAFVKTKCGLSEIRHVSTLPYKLNDLKADNLAVPNIVHYVWLSCRELELIHYLSILATYKFIQPYVIIIHGDCLPSGKFWTKIQSEVPNLYHVHEDRLTSIQGTKPRYIQHEADVMRLQILIGLSKYTTSKTIK